MFYSKNLTFLSVFALKCYECAEDEDCAKLEKIKECSPGDGGCGIVIENCKFPLCTD